MQPHLTKYNIRQRLYSLPLDQFYEVKYTILMKIKRTEKTLENWMNIPIDAKQSIPEEDFYIIAEVFKCRPEELKNEKK